MKAIENTSCLTFWFSGDILFIFIYFNWLNNKYYNNNFYEKYIIKIINKYWIDRLLNFILIAGLLFNNL